MAAALSRASGASGRLSVRDYRAADLAACARIYAAGSATALKRAVPAEPVLAFREATRGEMMLVVEEDGVVTGFAAVFAPEAFVHHLYVDEARRGCGAGAALLTAVAERIGRRASLKCRLDNVDALAFYARLGWREAERGTDAQAGAWVRLVSP